MPAATDASQARSSAQSKDTPSKEDEDDLRAINAALDRMRKVTPPDPYVLTIPQDIEPRYHHPNHPAWTDQWRYKAPFAKEDHENLQYQTFVYHEHGKEIYVLHNSRPLDESSSVGAGSNRARSGTGANTPSNSGPKKKITLGDYKKKLTGPNATATPEKSAVDVTDAVSKQGAVKGPVERVKAETEEMLAAVGDAEAVSARIHQEQHAPTHRNELKRKREEDAQPKKKEQGKSQAGSTPLITGSGAHPVVKKVKTEEKRATNEKGAALLKSDGAQRSSKHITEREQPREAGAMMGMPPRLSPGMPEKLSPPRMDDNVKFAKRAKKQDPQETALPRRLSATIPGNILKTLESRTHARSSSDLSAPNSASKSKDGKLTPLTKPNGITKKKSPVPRNGFRASSSPAVRSDAEERTISKPSATQRPKSPELSQDEEIAVGKAVAAHRSGRSSLLVRLKIRKSMRESIQRILKMRSQPERNTLLPPPKAVEVAKKTTETPGGQRHGGKTVAAPLKGVATKVGPVKKDKKSPANEEQKQTGATRRPPGDEEKHDAPARRVKTDGPRREPSTPAQKEVDSPMAHKSTLPATPGARKDLLSAATMQRQQSQDSVINHNTPPAQSSTPSIGISSSQANGVSRGPSSQPSNKTPKQKLWEDEQKRLEDLGKELKRAAAAEASANPKDLKTQKTIAIKYVESLLCYLLAFTCADEAAHVADPRQAPAWKTWRTLTGLYSFVKSVTKQFTHLNGLVCHLGVVYHARILDIATKYPHDCPDRGTLLETYGFMQKNAADADAKLDLDTLQDIFPNTWAKRAKNLSSEEELRPGKLGGSYRLPLGLTTSPIRTARAGHAMLLEWMDKEKIDTYSLKLKF